MEFRLNRERKTIKAAKNLWEMQLILTSLQSLGLRKSVLLGLSLGQPSILQLEETFSRGWERNDYPEGRPVMMP